MNSFIFSINATFPVFLLIVIGYFLKRFKITTNEFVSITNRINYILTLPALLFIDISKTDIIQVFDLKYVLFCALVTTVSFFSIWGISKKCIKDKSITGAFVQASFRGSAAVLGVAFIQNMYGSSGMAPLMIVGTVPLYNIYSVIVLTFESNNGSKKSLKSAFVNIITNPIIIAIFAGVIASLLKIDFPFIIDKTLSNIASIATPMALIAIGAGFEGRKAIAKLKPTIISSAIKLVLQPAIFLPIAVMLGFRDQKLVALMIMLAAPTTASCYIMASSTGNDSVLTSSVVVMTTFLSSITLTLIIFILKNMCLI
ncbi:MAG: AEC family transporter [Lachnospiraceae bacterium]|nr:AEC family transporter [Lachnospiraceae bacterium]